MIRISRSQVELFIECPRCFWLEVKHKIKRPQAIKGGFIGSKYDSKLKLYFDKLRLKGEPLKELESEKLKLYTDFKKLKEWRYKGLEFHHEDHKIVYWGKIDDLLVNENGLLVPFDYKVTTSNTLQIYDSEKRQLEFYGFLFSKLKSQLQKEVADIGVIYKIRVDIDENFEKIEERKFFLVELDYSKYEELLENLKNTYFSSNEPEPSGTCEYCNRDQHILQLRNRNKSG
ncbi:PD-(D/E)XK nuclease family protein [Thermodesulfobacterium thermophilum]|uniref:PD-(D/E)XK nuclease family protein n=1 Tax=Thermodesulfobacterium thermophilum TaxID=886 RepID=UPI0003B3E132|nr:PD-(D/E)XK nuclease family protein [Thermodesulfobacterium thermophilum]